METANPTQKKIQIEYDPNELVHKLFERVLSDNLGYRITDYSFMGNNTIELTLSR